MSRVSGLFPVLLLILVLIAGCGVDKDKGLFMAAGSYGDLAVVLSDESLRPAVDRFLSKLNPEVTFVISREQPFNVDVFEADNIDLCKNYKNIMFILRVGDGGKVQKQVSRLVSEQTMRQFSSGSGALVQLENPFSTYQFCLIAAANDRNSLASLLAGNADKIKALIEDKSAERIQRHNRHVGLLSKQMAAYWGRYKFYLEVPNDLRENQVEPNGFAGLELMCTAPSRGISISWQPSEDPVAMIRDNDYLVAMRAAMGEALHNEELVAETFIWRDAELNGIACRKLEGSWNSNTFAGGGPFWCYFIPDVQNQRLICLDLLVYAPQEKKSGYFRNLDAVAHTFSLRQPHQ